jgi:hypothetical protein
MEGGGVSVKDNNNRMTWLSLYLLFQLPRFLLLLLFYVFVCVLKERFQKGVCNCVCNCVCVCS